MDDEMIEKICAEFAQIQHYALQNHYNGGRDPSDRTDVWVDGTTTCSVRTHGEFYQMSAVVNT